MTVKIKWVRSHLKAVDVEEGAITYLDWVGNDWADTAAKGGANQHAVQENMVK